MATATIGNRVKNLTPEERAERKRAAALAELERNGIEVDVEKQERVARVLAATSPADRERDEFESAAQRALNAHALATHDPTPIAPLPLATRNIVSARDAQPMAKADICNVSPLKPAELDRLISRVKLVDPKLAMDLQEYRYQDWNEWSDDDTRWGLTPHQLRKLRAN